MAEKVLPYASDRFKNGVTNNVEVVQTQDSLTCAYDNHFNAQGAIFNGRLFLWRKRNVPRRTTAGTQKAGGHLPAQGIQDANEKRKDNERVDCHALFMAATGFHRKMKRRWKIWRIISSGPHFLRSACAIWNRKERSSIGPNTEGIQKNLCAELAGGHVFAYPKPGRTDGSLLWLLLVVP
jgi:hypothetical protein